jgi:hypothetical protein
VEHPTPFYQRYQHQEVRDLAWCCVSSPLLDTLPGSDASIWRNRSEDEDQAWLDNLDQNPAPLLNHLAENKSTRLGLYYEHLLKFYWLAQPDIRLLAHNVQINTIASHSGKSLTFGAMDFLIQQAAEFWHLEAAVKFYLGLPTRTAAPKAHPEHSGSPWNQWLGPNCNDRLDIKLDRMRQHQLPLSQTALAQPLLHSVNPTALPWRRGLCLQGYLFYPGGESMAAPLAAHPQHLRGSWWHLRDFSEALKTTTATANYWLILPRARWLSPAQTTDIHTLYSSRQLVEALGHWVGHNNRPQLITAMRKEEERWIETARSFIVPDHWPWTGRPSRNT